MDLTLPNKNKTSLEVVNSVYESVLKYYPFLTKKELKEFKTKAITTLQDKTEIENKPIRVATTLISLLNNSHADIKLYHQQQSKNLPQKLFSHQVIKDALYIKIPHWVSDPNISNQLIDLVSNSLSKINSIVIDVRDNDGGNSNYAHQFASIFFNTDMIFGKIVSKNSQGQLSKKPYKIHPHLSIYVDKPLCIIINGRCFSSNELFIAPFKVLHRALLVGTKTRGGSANPIRFILKSLDNYYRVRIPTWRFFLGNNTRPIEETGIEPDLYYDKDDIINFSIASLTN